MTIFGIDISNNQGPNIDMARVKAEGFEFVFCKVSEGDDFVDSTWPHYRDAAQAAGLLVAGYHYLRSDQPVEGQAALFVNCLGDFPAMIDLEANSGDMGTFWSFANAVNTLGHSIALSYIPHWYAGRIGNPDLSKVPGLISSSYVTGEGYASALYPGDDSPYWNGYCGAGPAILQYTDQADVAGYRLDANAFRGTRADLERLLGNPIPNQSEEDMALLDEMVTTQYNAAGQVVAADGSNGPNVQMPVGQVLSWLDGRVARAEGSLADINAKLDRLLAKVAG